MVWIKEHILEWLKDYPKYFLPFGLFAAFCLFIPDSVLSFIGILELRNQFKPYFGIAFILSITFLLTAILTTTGKWVREQKTNWIKKHMIIKRLNRLSPEESDILRKYIQEKTYTLNLDITKGVVWGLVKEGIIFMASNASWDPGEKDFNIPLWIWDYINKYQQCLVTHDLPKN